MSPMKVYFDLNEDWIYTPDEEWVKEEFESSIAFIDVNCQEELQIKKYLKIPGCVVQVNHRKGCSHKVN